MKFIGSPVRFAWILGVLTVPVVSTQAQGVTHVFNGAAAHDGAVAARLAAEAHLGSDAKAMEHFHSPEASSHLTITHPSASEFNGFEGHGTTVSHDTPKVEPRPEPRVTAPAAKIHPSSSEFAGFEGHGNTPRSVQPQKVGIVAKNGTKIGGFTEHGIDRAVGDTAKRAGTKPEAILDAVKSPKKIASGIDSKGRPYQVFTGQDARVVANPETGKIVSVNPLSGAGAHK